MVLGNCLWLEDNLASRALTGKNRHVRDFRMRRVKKKERNHQRALNEKGTCTILAPGDVILTSRV